jgi:phage baseplate assembly protein W
MNGSAITGQEFLGSGLAFPLHLDARGQIAMNHLEDQVRQSILLILRTTKGERLMHPEFGAGLNTLVFAPASPMTAALAQHAVQESLTRFEPRIDVLNVTATVDPQRPQVLQIALEYRIRQTDAVFNLVYPFYLERGEF